MAKRIDSLPPIAPPIPVFFSRKVEVTFVDAATGQPMATSKMDPEQLPETFLIDTTLHLGDTDWRVLQAEPPTRAQFSRTRRLVLTVQRVQDASMDPRTILFSLPTIVDALPAEGEAADGSEMVLHEDDWRQVELVSASLRGVVDGELRAIQRIFDECRQGPGFTEIHVRNAPDEPLMTAIPLEALDALGPGTRRPLRLDRHGERVRGGFARGDVLYGVAQGGRLRVLALHPHAAAPPDDVVRALEALAREHDLVLVDWCRRTVAEPGDGSFAAAFG